jgi:shikimate kinase
MNNVFLIGYRGCGKTSVAKALGERLGWPWFDADVELERRVGRSIKTIFAEQGEAAFRDLEQAVIADLAQHDQAVIAFGGGAILRAANRQAIREKGLTVWLQASPEALWQRIQSDPTTSARRPDLTAHGGLAEIRRLLDERTPLYAECAAHRLNSEAQTPEELADQIAHWLP